jgi:DNA recombination protein RmuC
LSLVLEPISLAWAAIGFAAGLLLGLVLAGSRRRLARQLLAQQDAQRQAETEALLDGVKAAFGEMTGESLRHAADDLVRLSQASFGVERRLQGQQLAAERAEFEARIGVVLTQLERMQALIRELERDRGQKFGELAARLDAAGQEAKALVAQTRSLAAALGNARVRGQWGERMAEDVLRLAGMVEGVSYRRQLTTPRGMRPDFTFLLPHGLVLHMDVKFPFENWLKLVETTQESDRARTAAAFVRDVRARIAEVAERGYVAPSEGTLDFALLFIPNEQVMAAALELEPALVDEALGKSVILTSPATLFAVLAVVRRSVDSFRLAEAARDVVGLLTGFREAWSGYVAESQRVGQALEDAVAAFDRLRGLRTRKLDQRLAALDSLVTAEAAPAGSKPQEVR